MIELKTRQELATMRRAGQVVGGLLRFLVERVAPGVTTKWLDEQALQFIRSQGADTAFLGYRGFPGTICVSINDEVVHGIPGPRQVKPGDLVSLDVGAKVEGFYADAAVTVAVGEVPPRAAELVDVTRRALESGIAKATPANRLSDISHAVQTVVEAAGLVVVRDFVGHGIGRALHEDPAIPNYGAPNQGPRLKPGMVLAIEPMVTIGTWEVDVLSDGWTAVTKDRSLAAHFEHTVAITEQGPEVLTSWGT
jgi:methionyl aminopeptidase